MASTVSSQIRQSREQSGGKSLSFPEDLGQHGILMRFKKYAFQNPGTRRLLSNSDMTSIGLDSILLPLPSNIADSYSVRIGRPEMGVVNEAVATAASAASKSGGSITNVMDHTYNAIKSLGISEMQARDLITGGSSASLGENIKFLLRSNIPGGFGTAIDQGIGATTNPKMALSFDGIDLKTHSFDWKFMVRSPNESVSLRDINQTIKRNLHPTYANAGGFLRAMLRYPSVVDVFFVGLDSDYFMKFKTCMIQAYSMNFTPDAVSIIEGGKPAGALMSIQLVETDIHTAEDYGGTSNDNGMLTDELGPMDFGPQIPR